VNGEWIRMLDKDDFIERAREFVDPAYEHALRALGALAQERVKVLSALPEYFDWVDGPADDSRSWDKAMKPPVAAQALDEVIARYDDAPWERDALHAGFLASAERLELSPRKLDGPIRVALTGRLVGLPLFDVAVYLGRDETLARLRTGRARLG
jgi:glutamyl-tRNA synthetase